MCTLHMQASLIILQGHQSLQWTGIETNRGRICTQTPQHRQPTRIAILLLYYQLSDRRLIFFLTDPRPKNKGLVGSTRAGCCHQWLCLCQAISKLGHRWCKQGPIGSEWIHILVSPDWEHQHLTEDWKSCPWPGSDSFVQRRVRGTPSSCTDLNFRQQHAPGYEGFRYPGLRQHTWPWFVTMAQSWMDNGVL